MEETQGTGTQDHFSSVLSSYGISTCCDGVTGEKRWGFEAHPALALSSTFHQLCCDRIDKVTGITRALGSYWDIIRVLVHFPGCFPIRGGTAGIMDGADVWREGTFGLHGWLMSCTVQCWGGVKSVIPGMRDEETSWAHPPHMH